MPTRLPNIVFVFPDELRAQAVPPTREDPTATPNLDRFAAESLALTQATATSPVCSPYRAMLLTGRFPHSTGVLEVCNSDQEGYSNFLAEDARCWSDVLAEAGASCGYVGKWHLDHPDPSSYPYTEGRRRDGLVWDSYTPPGRARHGFSYWYAYGVYDNHMHPHYWTGDSPIEERIDIHQWSVRHETDVAIEFVRNTSGQRDPDRPFCLVVSHNPPHMPFNMVPEEYRTPYRGSSARALLNRPNLRLEGRGATAPENVEGYFAAVTGVDEQFGRLLRAIDDAGLTGETIVVFTSDHGEMMGSHGRIGKDVWYEESLRVPFLIRWPDRIRPGTDDLLLGAADIMPTLLGLAGLGDRIPTAVQGTDYSALLLGRPGPPRPRSALYLDLENEDPAGGKRGVRTHRHTFVRIREEGRPEVVILHDNLEDPYQLRNVAAENPGLVTELGRELDLWLVLQR